MRFKAVFVAEETAVIPESFYAVFSSLIGEALTGYRLDGEPYTFSLRLNSGVKFSDGEFEGVRFVLFRFSTGEPEIFDAVIDHVIGIKDRWEGVVVGTGKFRVGDITLEPEVKLRGSLLTSSPVVVEGKGGFVLPESPDFNSTLLESVGRRMERITGTKPTRLTLTVSDYTVVRVPSLRGTATGFVGRLRISSDRDTLRFIYDYGLGDRTADGFGMLDVV